MEYSTEALNPAPATQEYRGEVKYQWMEEQREQEESWISFWLQDFLNESLFARPHQHKSSESLNGEDEGLLLVIEMETLRRRECDLSPLFPKRLSFQELVLSAVGF